MTNNWESTFTDWAKPLGISEEKRCENAEKAIRNAISKSSVLNTREIKVFRQGSYHNNTNVRNNSDVDIGVCCYDTFFPEYPDDTDKNFFNHIDSEYSYNTFKKELHQSLVSYFGSSSVKRGNKALNLKENTYHVEADVVPFFEHRRYYINKTYISGVVLRPDNSPFKSIRNWPEQHYSNGVKKNKDTGRRFKRVVRILKKLCIEMESSIPKISDIPGFLIECLVWNVPNDHFNLGLLTADVRASLAFLYNNTRKDEQCSEWGEVSELKYLFRQSQSWSRISAHNFIDKAWDYLGFE